MGMIKGIVGDIVYILTCVQYKDEVTWWVHPAANKLWQKNQAAEQKESNWLVLLERGITSSY